MYCRTEEECTQARAKDNCHPTKSLNKKKEKINGKHMNEINNTAPPMRQQVISILGNYHQEVMGLCAIFVRVNGYEFL